MWVKGRKVGVMYVVSFRTYVNFRVLGGGTIYYGHDDTTITYRFVVVITKLL